LKQKKINEMSLEINDSKESKLLSEFLILFAHIVSNLYVLIWKIINSNNMLTKYGLKQNISRIFFFRFVSGTNKIPIF
jgi:hypothetical protein